MSNVEKLQKYIDEQQANGLVSIRLMPATRCKTNEQLAGNVLAIINAPVVQDSDLF